MNECIIGDRQLNGSKYKTKAKEKNNKRNLKYELLLPKSEAKIR